MKFVLMALLVGTAAAAVTQENDPLSKVYQMMDELTAKVTKEGEAENNAYHEFFEWCDDTASSTQNEIKTYSAKKEDLGASLDKLESDIEDATVKIDDLSASIAKDTKELKAATAIRDKEHATFAAEEGELVEGIDTLARAIGIIEKGMAKAGGASAFAQVDMKSFKNVVAALGTVMDAAAVESFDKGKLMAFVQQRHEAEENADADADSMGAPAAAATEAHGGGIVDVLNEMKDKADQELGELRAAETESKNNFMMLKQSLDDSIAADSKDLQDEKDGRNAATEQKATNEGDLELTTKALAQCQEDLTVNNNNCMQTATDHENSMKSRAEELKVIAEAKKILQEATGGASALQTDGDVSLMQMSSSQRLGSMEVVAFVKKLAKKFNSPTLSMLASKIQAAVRFSKSSKEDPFAKIKGLIVDMLAKLEKEAKEDAQEKAYCDEQMAKTGEKWQGLTDRVEKLSSKIDKATSSSTELKESVKELQAELATLQKEQKEMDRIRKDQNDVYTSSKEEQEKALAGIRKALEMLRKHYGGASMMQMDTMMEQPKMPASHGSAGGAGGGIISMLEICESDFAKELAATEKQEADSQEEYDSTTAENDKSKVTKTQDVKYQTMEFTALDKSLAELSADKETVSEELDAVNSYFAKVKDRCVAKPISYEEIKKRRDAEIAGLKEAQGILEGSFLQGSRRFRGIGRH